MDFTPIFVVGIVVLGIYRLFELFVRRQERMEIIRKLGSVENFTIPLEQLNLPLFSKKAISSVSSWALKISLLMIGVGIGLVIAFFIENAIFGEFALNNDVGWMIENKMAVVYFACVVIFGGIGLLVAYLIESKKEKSDK